MNNFGQIVGNVGVRIGDTSSSFALIIKGYVNYRYRDIFERFNWPTLNPSYSFNTVIGQQDYDVPTDFNKEMYLYDSINLVDISCNSLQDLERIYSNTLGNTDQPIKYAIYDYMSTDSVPVIKKKLRLYPTPSTVITIQMPYLLKPTDMSGNTDLPILDCDLACELGATADAWRTKRQFAKAADFDTQYDNKINTMIWNKENNPNRIVQFVPRVYNREMLY